MDAFFFFVTSNKKRKFLFLTIFIFQNFNKFSKKRNKFTYKFHTSKVAQHKNFEERF